jgi:transcriptional regulator with XRE-family HTH domain
MASVPESTATPPSVADAIKRLRRHAGLSLDELAQRCGVSRSMLSQIERDTTNPTVATLWRITQALGVSIDEVLGQPKPVAQMECTPQHALPRMSSTDGLVQLRVLGPLETAGQYEWYEFTAQPGGSLSSKAHSPGTREHVYVVEGCVRVSSQQDQHTAHPGDMLRYAADVPHELHNPGPGVARAWLTVLQPR